MDDSSRRTYLTAILFVAYVDISVFIAWAEVGTDVSCQLRVILREVNQFKHSCILINICERTQSSK